jgi:hypothetical protein
MAVEKRIEELGAEIAAAMYCDTVGEALALAGSSKMKHEIHVVRLHPQRAELAFLHQRHAQLKESK